MVPAWGSSTLSFTNLGKNYPVFPVARWLSRLYKRCGMDLSHISKINEFYISRLDNRPFESLM